MTIRNVDLPIWNEVFGGAREPPVLLDWCDSHDPLPENPAGATRVSCLEANYAWGDELILAARRGAVFAGYHGVGGEYGQGEFLGLEGGYYEQDTTDDGLVVPVSYTTGRVDQEELRQIRRYLKLLKRVDELLRKTPPCALNASGGSTDEAAD
jgi:hypothetical protein